MRGGGEPRLPRRRLVGLARLAADGEHRGAVLERHGATLRARVSDIDEGTGLHFDLVVSECEPSSAGQHDVDLLVLELRLAVLLHDVRSLVCGVRVDPERADPERPADRPPADVRGGDRDLLEILDPPHLVRAQLALLSSRSTTGSIAASPSTRSSRFAAPAQSASASYPRPESRSLTS